MAVNKVLNTTSFTISGVRPYVSQSETSALMDTMIAKDVFCSNGGSLTTKYSAQLTEIAVTRFTVQ